MQFSIVIPTRNRSKDLYELLTSLIAQDFQSYEVVIIDDSSTQSCDIKINNLLATFKKIGKSIKYVKGCGDGLPRARNIGLDKSKGDAILFLDDDVVLESEVLSTINNFFVNHSEALGVQVNIISPYAEQKSFLVRVFNILNRLFLLTSYEPNKLLVQRSGISIFPRPLTNVIIAQRMSGCCCCFRRNVFSEFRFDENLKKYASMEDIDFSFRVYKKYPNSLYAIPSASVFHKNTSTARLPQESRVSMSVIYWFYVFFKNVYENSILNLLSFLWALAGNLSVITCTLIAKRKPKDEWWTLIYTITAYRVALTNLRSILRGRLEFFNNTLRKQQCFN
jgi:glucosyl-dolichyl phosphate glucuronosyltransferase